MTQRRSPMLNIADIGDYLKVFACTAVMSQPIMSMILGVGQPTQTQDVFGLLYNLVKYTAPAFIFGILYSTIRTNDLAGAFSYQKHMRASWSNLFVPTFWWTLVYLLGMPWLQFIILMPLFWAISCYVGQNTKCGTLVALVAAALYFAWLYFYVFHGVHERDWYLLDHFFGAWLLTWLLSFASAYLLHCGWSSVKQVAIGKSE